MVILFFESHIRFYDIGKEAQIAEIVMINIVYCGNDAMFDGILLSLLSASKVTKDSLNVFLLTGGFTEVSPAYKPLVEGERAFLEKLLQSVNKESQVHLLDLTKTLNDEFAREKNIFSKYTPYCLMRLFLDMEPSIPSKVLYLDTDTIIMNDLAPFFAIDLKDKDLACVLDNVGKMFWHPGYLNSGVLLLDLDKIRLDGSFHESRDIAADRKMKHPDQDALNKVLRRKKKVLVLTREYNEQRVLFPNTIVRHFTPVFKFFPYPHMANVKSWQIDKVHNVLHTHAHDELYGEYIKLKEAYLESTLSSEKHD